jgi:DUF971 family protein
VVNPAREQLIQVRRLSEERALELTFQDGHRGEYPWDYLRGFCPCAMCQGHGNTVVHYKPARQPVEPRTIEPAGLYGLSIHWSDGHGTGIYRFGFLREICPCAECRADHGDLLAAHGVS